MTTGYLSSTFSRSIRLVCADSERVVFPGHILRIGLVEADGVAGCVVDGVAFYAVALGTLVEENSVVGCAAVGE